MLHSLQLNMKGSVELSDRTGQHHGAPRRVLLHHKESVRGGEGTHYREIRGVRAMPLRKFLAAQGWPTSAPGRKLRDARPKLIAGASPHDDAHLQPFRRIRRRQYSRARQGDSLAAFQRNVGHDYLLECPDLSVLKAGFIAMS
jgi:hypothetical protein